MASTVRAKVEGVASMQQALTQFGNGLERELAIQLQQAVEPIVAGTRARTPRGPGPRIAAKNPNDRLPHLADTIYASAHGRYAEIIAAHPAGGLFEYGGSIRPRGPRSKRIDVGQHAMAHKAADADLPRLERDLERRLDALAARVGL